MTPASKDHPTQRAPWWKREIGASRAPSDDSLEHTPFAPTLPQVSLLPSSVRESITITRDAKVLVLLLVILLAVGSAVWWMQGQAIDQAESDLARVQAQNAALQQEKAALAPAAQFYNEITSLENLVSTTLADQPQAQAILRRLDRAVADAGGPTAVEIVTAAITYTGLPTPGEALTDCPNPDPFASEITIGCLSFTATADSRSAVSDLLRSLEGDPMFVGPYVTTTTATGTSDAEQPTVSFTGSAGIDVTGLAVAPSPEQVDEILNPPQATPSPSPTSAEQPPAEVTP
jgi:hypothetical protein